MEKESIAETAGSYPGAIGPYFHTDGSGDSDALVVGHESLYPALNLPDPDDVHVLAAAIRSNAEVIVTFNLKDFPHPHCAVSV